MKLEYTPAPVLEPPEISTDLLNSIKETLNTVNSSVKQQQSLVPSNPVVGKLLFSFIKSFNSL